MADDLVKAAGKALYTEVFNNEIYIYLASSYPEKEMRQAFSDIIEMEKTHIVFWHDFLTRHGGKKIEFRPNSVKLALYKILLRVLGKSLTLRLMEVGENQAIELYSTLLDSPGLSAAEKEGLRHVLEDELVHEKLLTNEETKYEGITTNIKDAVLGLSDGLVEILSVTTGLAAASGRPVLVATTGLVVAIAGGLSMGISSYASSRSQRQVSEGIIKRISLASKFAVHFYRERLAGHLEKRGYSSKTATNVADEAARDSRLLSDFIAEQEYGLREERLADPVSAGLYAGFANLFGAFIPLLPYFFLSSITTALVVSLILATGALALTGLLVSILAYMPPGRKIGEMFLSGLGSAAITYVIGRAAAYLLGAVAL